jgi:hypothetical protein
VSGKAQVLLVAGDGVPDDEACRWRFISADQHAAVKGGQGGVDAGRQLLPGETSGWDKGRVEVVVVDVAQ